MGSFEEDKDIIKQNLECVTECPDAVFGIWAEVSAFAMMHRSLAFLPVSTVFILQKRIKIYHRSY